MSEINGKVIDKVEAYEKEVRLYFTDGTYAVIFNEHGYVDHKVKLKIDFVN